MRERVRVRRHTHARVGVACRACARVFWDFVWKWKQARLANVELTPRYFPHFPTPDPQHRPGSASPRSTFRCLLVPFNPRVARRIPPPLLQGDQSRAVLSSQTSHHQSSRFILDFLFIYFFRILGCVRRVPAWFLSWGGGVWAGLWLAVFALNPLSCTSSHFEPQPRPEPTRVLAPDAAHTLISSFCVWREPVRRLRLRSWEDTGALGVASLAPRCRADRLFVPVLVFLCLLLPGRVRGCTYADVARLRLRSVGREIGQDPANMRYFAKVKVSSVLSTSVWSCDRESFWAHAAYWSRGMWVYLVGVLRLTNLSLQLQV